MTDDSASRDFPTAPPPPTPSYSASSGAAAIASPRQVNIGFWLYIVAAALSVVGLIISAVTVGARRTTLQHQVASAGHTQLTSSDINTLITIGVVVGVVFAVIWVALFVLFAVFMRRGAGWARIVLTIVTALSLVNILGSYGAGALQVAAAIVATVLIWLRPSSEYFAAVRASRTRI